MSEQIQVQAGWWRQRCGDIVRVWRDDEDADYPWASANSSYMENGAVFAGFHDGSDLVEFLGVEDPTLRPAQDGRPELVRRFAVAILQGDSATPVATSARLSASTIWSMAEQMADAEPSHD